MFVFEIIPAFLTGCSVNCQNLDFFRFKDVEIVFRFSNLILFRKKK